MNPEKYKIDIEFVSDPHTGPKKKKTRKKTRKKSVQKVSTGSTRPKKVFALRSDEKHDDAGVWVKVFMLYAKNTVAMVEFENGEIDCQSTHTYESARNMWEHWIEHEEMHRDDSYIEGLDLGNVRI